MGPLPRVPISNSYSSFGKFGGFAMNYADIRPIDVANGPGGTDFHLRVWLYAPLQSVLTRRPGTSRAVSPSAREQIQEDTGLPVQTLHSWFVPAGGEPFEPPEPAGGAGAWSGRSSPISQKGHLVLLRLSVLKAFGTARWENTARSC